MASRRSASNLKRLEDLRRKYKLGEFSSKRAARPKGSGRTERGRGRRRSKARPSASRPSATSLKTLNQFSLG